MPKLINKNNKITLKIIIILKIRQKILTNKDL